MTKRSLIYGLIFIGIYGIILLIITLYFGNFRPIEADTILPLLSLVLSLFMKPELIGVKLLQQFGPEQAQFILVLIQVFTAFVQGAIIGVVVTLFVHKKTTPIQ